MAVATPLATVEQSNWGAGEFQGVPPQFVPPNGLIAARNACFDLEEQIAYRRGGSTYFDSAGLGATGITFLWTGTLAGQPWITVISDGTNLGYITNISQPVRTLSLPASAPSYPNRPALVRGVLYIPGGTIWAGSAKTANYSTGTIAYTANNRLVLGTGTSWSGNVDAGMLIQFGGSGPWYPVANTTITNTDFKLVYGPAADLPPGTTYTLAPVAALPTYPLGSDNYPIAAATSYATIFGRFVVGSGDTIGFSSAADPQIFDPNDYHVLPAGASVTALVPLRGDMFVFTNKGVWKIDNMGYDLTDEYGNVQQSLTKVSDLRQLQNFGSSASIAEWHGALVVPCDDGIWMMDGVSTPQRIDMADEGRYRQWVRIGRGAGGAVVYNNHYILPVFFSNTSAPDTVLCLRLDHPQSTPFGAAYPTSYFDGYGANVLQYAVRSVGSGSTLLGGSTATGRVLNCKYFDPGASAAVKNDADGSSHVFQLDTRDYADQRVPQHFRRASLLYELTDAGDNPSITASYSSDPAGATWAAFSDTAGPSTGTTPKVWNILKSDGSGVKSRFLRFRFQSVNATPNLKIRLLRLWVRPSGRDH